MSGRFFFPAKIKLIIFPQHCYLCGAANTGHNTYRIITTRKQFFCPKNFFSWKDNCGWIDFNAYYNYDVREKYHPVLCVFQFTLSFFVNSILLPSSVIWSELALISTSQHKLNRGSNWAVTIYSYYCVNFVLQFLPS